MARRAVGLSVFALLVLLALLTELFGARPRKRLEEIMWVISSKVDSLKTPLVVLM